MAVESDPQLEWIPQDNIKIVSNNFAVQTAISISALIEKLRSNEYLIPPFQRSFDWGKDHVLKLFESLYKTREGIGTIVLGKVRNDNSLWSRNAIGEWMQGNDRTYYILDGQQRSLSMYTVLTGFGINQDHKSNQVKKFELMYNPFLDTFELYSEKKASKDAKWIRLKDTLTVRPIVNGSVIGQSEFNAYWEKLTEINPNICTDIDYIDTIRNRVYRLYGIPSSNIYISTSEYPDVDSMINRFIDINRGKPLKKADVVSTKIAMTYRDILNKLRDFPSKTRRGKEHYEKFSKIQFTLTETDLLEIYSEVVYHCPYQKMEKAVTIHRDRIDSIFNANIWEQYINTLIAINIPNVTSSIRKIVLTGFVIYLHGKCSNLSARKYATTTQRWIVSTILKKIMGIDEENIIEQTLGDMKRESWRDLITTSCNHSFDESYMNELSNIIASKKSSYQSLPNMLYSMALSKSGSKVIFSNNAYSDYYMRPDLKKNAGISNTKYDLHHFFARNLMDSIGVGKTTQHHMCNMVVLESRPNRIIADYDPFRAINILSEQNDETANAELDRFGFPRVDQPNLLEPTIQNIETMIVKRSKVIASQIKNFVNSIPLRE